MKHFAVSLSFLLLMPALLAGDAFHIRTQVEWEKAVVDSKGVSIKNGTVAPTGEAGRIRTRLQRLDQKTQAISLTLTQSAVWQNWIPIENLGPENLRDAPVLLTVGPGNYWMFGRYGNNKPKAKRGEQAKRLVSFTPQEAKLEGFDMPLQTTRFPNQFNAPGGLKPGKGGYHAWQSRDMKNWVHHGPVTEGFSRWVTSAEWVDGKAYIYYDFPNDQDPVSYTHLTLPTNREV